MRLNSIRLILPLTIVLPLAFTAGVLGYVSQRDGQKEVREISTLLGGKVIDQSRDRIAGFLGVNLLVLQGAAAATSTSNLDLNRNCLNPDLEAVCLEEVTDFLYGQVNSQPAIQSMLFSSPNGIFVKVGREGNRILLDRRPASTGLRQQYTRTFANDGWQTTDAAPYAYNPLERDWFLPDLVEPAFGEVYEFASGGRGITASVALYDGDLFMGVLAIDVPLNLLEGSLTEIAREVSESTRITISESSASNPFVISGEDPDPEDSIWEFNCLRSAGDLGNGVSCNDGTLLDLENNRYLVISRQLQDSDRVLYNLPDWHVTALAPEVEFIGGLHESARRFSLAAILLVGGSTVLGVTVSALWIAGPITRLGKAAHDIGEGTFDPETLDDLEPFPDELNRLAKLFQAMGRSINDRMQEVNAQIAQLQSRNQEFEAAQQRGAGGYHSLLQRSRAFRQSRSRRAKAQASRGGDKSGNGG